MPLHPSARALLDLIAEAEADGTRKRNEDMEPAEARQAFIDTRGPVTPAAPEVAHTADVTIARPNGDQGGDLALRYYRPIGTSLDEKLPVFVYFHGGGWVVGNLDTHDVVARQIANTSGFAVLSVDYRLSPETKFPGAVEDAMAAVEWAAAGGDGHKYGLAIDPTRIVVGGDSAGGNLAAVVCLLARDKGGPKIAQQTLIYPVTDFHRRHPSHKKYAEGHLLTSAGQDWFAGHYLRSDADKDDWRASPLLAEDLSGLPPAIVITAEFDPLHDEGKAYADRLSAAGVPVSYHSYDGMLHGYIGMGKLFRETNDTIAEIAAHARRVLADLDEENDPASPPHLNLIKSA